MINTIIDGISVKLNDEFGDTYKIYTEEVSQSLTTPCFFINTLKNQENLFRGNRYFQVNPFVIQYIPNTNEKKKECNEIKERLFNALEYITIKETIDDESIEELIRGVNLSSEYSEGVLNFFISYNMYVYKKETVADNMNECDYANSVRG